MKIENASRRAANVSPWNIGKETTDANGTQSQEERVSDQDNGEEAPSERRPPRKAITWGL